MMDRARERALKHAILPAREVQPRLPAQAPGVAAWVAPYLAAVERQLDALAALANRLSGKG